jgi:glycine cleavage system pyridoxal-binding protein P
LSQSPPRNLRAASTSSRHDIGARLLIGGINAGGGAVKKTLDRRLPCRHHHVRADQHRQHAFRLVGLDETHAAHVGSKVEDPARVAHGR